MNRKTIVCIILSIVRVSLLWYSISGAFFIITSYKLTWVGNVLELVLCFKEKTELLLHHLNSLRL